MTPGVSSIDAAFALSVTGAAMLGSIVSPAGAALALFVAAGWWVWSAWLTDKRTPPKADG